MNQGISDWNILLYPIFQFLFEHDKFLSFSNVCRQGVPSDDVVVNKRFPSFFSPWSVIQSKAASSCLSGLISSGLIVFVVCNVIHILHNVHCLSDQLFVLAVQLITILATTLTFLFQDSWRCLFHFKSNINDLFVIVFYCSCSIAFQDT